MVISTARRPENVVCNFVSQKARIMKKHSDQAFLFTRRDAKDRWQVSIETLKRWEKAGRLKPLKLGRGIETRMVDIVAFEKDAEVAK